MSETLPPRRDGICVDGTFEGHEWQPLSFVFETQLLDHDGRVVIRQPDLDKGRVYCVCMKCHRHTYIVTTWVNFYLPDPWAVEQAAAEDAAYEATHPESVE